MHFPNGPRWISGLGMRSYIWDDDTCAPPAHYPFGFAKACPVLPNKPLMQEEEAAVFDFLMKMHMDSLQDARTI